jgi:hypothetical protein
MSVDIQTITPVIGNGGVIGFIDFTPDGPIAGHFYFYGTPFIIKASKIYNYCITNNCTMLQNTEVL